MFFFVETYVFCSDLWKISSAYDLNFRLAWYKINVAKTISPWLMEVKRIDNELWNAKVPLASIRKPFENASPEHHSTQHGEQEGGDQEAVGHQDG